jgi:predicted enzyme related to lactoylglutathione lyase
MSDLPFPGLVLFVRDVRRVTSFYMNVAAMTLAHEDADHAVLRLDGFEFVVHAIRGEPEPTGAVQPREDSYMKVILPVASIAEARAVAAAHGGVVQPAAREWEARGFRACDGHDPEGNIFQVREATA